MIDIRKGLAAASAALLLGLGACTEWDEEAGTPNAFPFPEAPSDPVARDHWKHLQGHLDYLYDEDMSDPSEHSSGCLRDEMDESADVLDDLDAAIADAKAIPGPTAADTNRLNWLQDERTYVSHRKRAMGEELQLRSCVTQLSYVQGFYRYTNQSVGDFSSSDNTYGVGGAVALPLRRPLRVQIDAAVLSWNPNIGHSTTAWSSGLQVGYQPQHDYFGGFGGAAGYKDAVIYGGGVDFTHYCPKWTVNTQVGYAVENIGHSDTWGGRMNVKYFYTPKLSFGVTGSGFSTTYRYSTGGGSTGGTTTGESYSPQAAASLTATSYSAGVGAEYQFGHSPVSVFTDYEHIWLNPGGANADAVKVGLRWNFGGTLKGRDRAGAGIPGFADWLGPAFGY
jgi:hypothetical protein